MQHTLSLFQSSLQKRALSLIASLFALMYVTPLQSFAQSANDTRGPISVLRIQALEATEGQRDQEQLAEYVTSTLIGGMKSERLPVKGLALVLDFNKGNEAQILQKAARKKGICYVLRGHIDAVDAEARNELLRYLYRVNVSITLELVDTESGKTLKTFQGKGLCSIQIDKKNVAGLTPFRGERAGEAPFAFRAASECVMKKLLPQIVKAYPSEARTPVKAGAGNAALHITVEAPNPDAAAEKGIREICKKLIPEPTPQQQQSIDKALSSKSMVQVNPTMTEGKYEISVSIDDLKADRPNLMKTLIDSGAIALPTVAVLAADSAVQTEIQNSLTRAGIQVKDEARLQQLRKRAYVTAMLDGKTDPQTLLSLKEDLGIDYIIVANAIVELTDFGRSGYTARALVRVKMMEPDTANFVSVGEEVESDEDVSGQIATEKAQKTATQLRMTGLLEDLFANLKPRTRQRSMEITITGWASRTDSKHFVDDLQKLTGVLKILRNKYEEPILTLTVEVGPEAKESLATDIESHKTMKKYGIKIQSDSATAIKGKRDSEKPVASEEEETTKPKPTATAPTVPTQKPTTKKPTVPTKPGKKKG